MFLFAPIGNGIRLRTVPVATLLLVAAQLVTAIVTLPDIDRVRAERSAAVTVQAPASGADAVRAEAGAAEAAARVLEARDPVHQWGLESGASGWRALSALFLHADVLHLAGNLLGLLVLGFFVEQAWGPVTVLLLALGGGAAALRLDAASGLPGTLAGSSAAVAVLLGAYVVLFAERPIRFGYVYFEYLKPLRGRIAVPVTALAGLWVVQQMGGLVLAACGVAGGIAYVSHLAGFAIGGLAARILPARLS